MKNIKLSGGNYGGYVVNNTKATLAEPQINAEDVEEMVVTDTVTCTVSSTVINVDGWLYDTSLSPSTDTAEFIGMA